LSGKVRRFPYNFTKLKTIRKKEEGRRKKEEGRRNKTYAASFLVICILCLIR
jgi:hypothetical protein